MTSTPPQSTTITDAITQILEITGHPQTEAQELANKLLKVISAKAFTKLIASKPQDARPSLYNQLKDTKESPNLAEIVATNWSPQEVTAGFSAASHEVLGDYLKEVLPHFSPQQKEQYQKILENLVASNLQNLPMPS